MIDLITYGQNVWANETARIVDAEVEMKGDKIFCFVDGHDVTKLVSWITPEAYSILQITNGRIPMHILITQDPQTHIIFT